MKICNKCKVEKPLEGFHKRIISRDGYTSKCKLCRCEEQRSYRRTPKGREVDRRGHKKYDVSEKGRARSRRKR